MGTKLKVLMLLENSPAFTDSRVWPEAITLRDHGLQVCIICPKASPTEQEPYICIDGIHIYQYRMLTSNNKYTGYFIEYSFALLMTFLLSFKVLFRHGFDVIHASNPPDIFFIIGLFYKLFGKKYVFDQHDFTPGMFQVIFKGRMKLVHKVLTFLEWCSYRASDLVITTNLSQKKRAIELAGYPAQQIFVVRNGPNLNLFKSGIPEPDLKKGWAYLLAYVGIIGVQDGVEYTLYALHELVHKRGRTNVALVLMGDGDHASVLHQLAHELQLDNHVDFTGMLDRKDVVRHLSVADIGLIPDPKNGLNEFCTMVKTMEYMAMEKPIVAFDLFETRFSAQDAALYAQPNLVEDFADKIETLLDDEELRFTLGARGHRRVEEELSWNHTKENLLLAYKTLFPESFESPVIHSPDYTKEKFEIHN